MPAALPASDGAAASQAQGGFEQLLAGAPADVEAGGQDRAPRGVVQAQLVGLADGMPLVMLPPWLDRSARPRLAQACCRLTCEDIGRRVAVMFIDGLLDRVIVVGPIAEPDASVACSCAVPETATPRRLELQASQELILRCGKAALRLLADGTAVVRGVNVVTRASATNRIRGGNVQIN